MVEVQHRGVGGRDILDDMVDTELVQEFPQVGDGSAATGGHEFLVNAHRERENARVAAHEGLQETGHLRGGEVHRIKRLAVCHNLDAGLDIGIFRHAPVAFPLDVLDGVPDRRLLQAEVLAEGREVQLEHAADARVVGNLEEDVHLLVDVLDEFHGREGDLLHLAEAAQVRAVPQEHRPGGLAVAARAPRFLEIGLRAFREVCVHHEADIGLVDAHAEGVGAHHHARVAGLPGLLPLRAGGGAQARVVIVCLHPRLAERGGEFLCPAAAAHIHDAAALHPGADAAELARLVLGFADNVAEVGALEARLFEVGRCKAQPLHDVLRHFRGGRGGEGDHRGVHLFAELPDEEIVRAEVVPPLGDTVGLVHHDVGHVEDAQVALEELGVEPFGGQVEELVVPIGGVVQGQVYLAAVHARMHGNGPDAAVPEVLYLVFHEGNQGRHHQRDAVPEEGRHLEADAFAAPRGEDSQDVPSGEGLADDLFLHGAEGVVAPVCL